MNNLPKKDEILELNVIDIGSEGAGIAKSGENLAIFIPGALPGDEVTAKIIKVKKNLANARLLEITKKSPFRVKPECSYFGTCNGCKMQNIDYKKQLEIKKQIVLNSIERIGGFAGINVADVISSDNIYFYRNKLEFSFSNNRWLTENDTDSNDISFALGFHMPGFIDKVLDIHKCWLQSELSNKILNFTRSFFKSKNESIYSIKNHEGFLRYLIIRQSANTKDLMVNLITSTENDNLIKEYADTLAKNIPEVTTLVNSIATTKAQAAISDYSNILYGKGYIEEKIGKYKFKITPNSFFQTNSLQCEKLFDVISMLAEFSKDENILDLYCGSGAISLYISEYVNKVTGIELNKESINMAKENAEINKVTNCEFEASDVKEYLISEVPVKTGISYSNRAFFDTIILDPPRSGIHPKAAEYLLQYEPKKIIYVSCNPATQARDIKLLSEKYGITAIQPVDMFPHTMHIENVVSLDIKG